ncbi:MAG: T9SS type A sorting domain-containing protein [Bacteroidetes bacterium]|nr:T9SS type A sorting domain-containing protein [Bacteroidota bacterium]
MMPHSVINFYLDDHRPTNGNLWFVYYDRRNYNDTRTDVYMARSTDGGITFENFKISDSPFIPDPGVFFGDYTNVTAHNNIIRPIWTRLDNVQLSLWTAIIDTTIVSQMEILNNDENNLLEQNYPNPFAGQTYFSFKLHKQEIVSLKIYDLTGRCIAAPINNQIMEFGKHIVKFETQVTQGTYFYELKAGEKLMRRKMMVVE